MEPHQIADNINTILKELTEVRNQFCYEAINWGCLHIDRIERIVTIYPESRVGNGDETIKVTIEEADPTAYALCRAIEKMFFERYGFHIEVATEW